MARVAGFGLLVVWGLSEESGEKEPRSEAVDQSLNQWWWNSNQQSSGSNRPPTSWTAMGSSAEDFSLAPKPISLAPRRDPRMYFDERSATWRIFDTTQLDAAATTAAPATTDDDDDDYDAGELDTTGYSRGQQGFFETVAEEVTPSLSTSDDLDGVPMRSLFSPLFDDTADKHENSDTVEGTADGLDGVPMRSLFSPLFDETEAAARRDYTDYDNTADGLDGYPMRSLFSPIFDETEAAARRDHAGYDNTADGLDGIPMRSLFSQLFDETVAEGKDEATDDDSGGMVGFTREDEAELSSFYGPMYSDNNNHQYHYEEAITQDLLPSTSTNDDEMVLVREETTPADVISEEGDFFEELREATMALVQEDDKTTSSSNKPRRNRPRRRATAIKRITLGRKATLREVDELMQALCRDNRFAKYSLEEMRGDLMRSATELAALYKVRVLMRSDDKLVLMRTVMNRLPVERTEIEALLERDEGVARDAGRLFSRLTGSSSGSGNKGESSEGGKETMQSTAEVLRSSGYGDAPIGDTFIDDSTSRTPTPEVQLPSLPRIVDEFVSPHHVEEKPTPRRLRQKPPRPPRRQTPRRLFTSAQEELQVALRDHQEESIGEDDETAWEPPTEMEFTSRKSASTSSLSRISSLSLSKSSSTLSKDPSPLRVEASYDIFDTLSAAVDSMATSVDATATASDAFDVPSVDTTPSEVDVPSLDATVPSIDLIPSLDATPSEDAVPSVDTSTVPSVNVPSDDAVPSLDDPVSAIHRQLMFRASTLHSRHRGGQVVGRVMMPHPHPHRPHYQQLPRSPLNQHQQQKPRSPPHQQSRSSFQPRSPYHYQTRPPYPYPQPTSYHYQTRPPYPYQQPRSPYHYHHQRSPYRGPPQRSPLRSQVVVHQSPQRHNQEPQVPTSSSSSSLAATAGQEQSWWSHLPNITLNTGDLLSTVIDPSSWYFEKKNEEEEMMEFKGEKMEEAAEAKSSSEQVISSELGVLPKEPKRLRFSQEPLPSIGSRALVDDQYGDNFSAMMAMPQVAEPVPEPIPAPAPAVVPPSAAAPSNQKAAPHGHNSRGHMNQKGPYTGKRSSGLRRRKNIPKRPKLDN